MKKIQDTEANVFRRGVNSVNNLRGKFNELGLTPDEALALGIALGAGGASSVVGGLVDMGTGEETGFGEAPLNIVGGALGMGGGAIAGGVVPAVAAKLRNNSISPQQRRQFLRGGAVGAGLGGFFAGSMMVSNDRSAATPDDQRSIAGSLDDIDRDDIIALLNANGVI